MDPIRLFKDAYDAACETAKRDQEAVTLRNSYIVNEFRPLVAAINAVIERYDPQTRGGAKLGRVDLETALLYTSFGAGRDQPGGVLGTCDGPWEVYVAFNTVTARWAVDYSATRTLVDTFDWRYRTWAAAFVAWCNVVTGCNVVITE